jgi:hypothetical protein
MVRALPFGDLPRKTALKKCANNALAGPTWLAARTLSLFELGGFFAGRVHPESAATFRLENWRRHNATDWN